MGLKDRKHAIYYIKCVIDVKDFAGMRCYEYAKGAIYLNIIPYTHLFGVVADLLGPLYSGGHICYGNKMAFFDNLRKYKPTNINLPPCLS